MNFIETIQSSEYIYSTYTRWGLKKFICDVEYYTEEPLSDLFFVVCSILDSNEGWYDKKALGILLGFSMYNDNQDGKHEVYYDVAEVKMFYDILAAVEKEHLIKVQEREVVLTELGRISLAENKHYRFYKGSQVIYEHLKLKSENPSSLLMFPFYRDLGICTKLSTKHPYWPEDDEIEHIIYYDKSDLIQRIESHSSERVNIYSAEQEEYFDVEIRKILIKLYKNGNGYLPVVTNEGVVAPIATSLILDPLNSDRREDLILECLFQKLWDDEESILSFEPLKPYFELVDFEELTKDSRTVWSDEKLFCVILENATSTCWRNITRFCDLGVLYSHLTQIKERIDWPIFTARVENDFILDNFIEYPWDLEILSEDNNRDIKVIEQLILLQKETEEDWNWDYLEHRLSSEFVLLHLDVVKVDLSTYTKDLEDVRKAILTHIDQRWDWDKVESDFELDFILKNINVLGAYFTYSNLFDRVFTDETWAVRYATDQNFKNALYEAGQDDGPLVSCILNDKAYKWEHEVIDLFYSLGLINWSTTPYMQGFECNPSLVWTKDFFNRYYEKIITEEGRSIVSKSIIDLDIVLSMPNFEWAWDDISANKALISDVRLYDHFGDKLNWSIVIDAHDDIGFIERINDIESMIADDEDAWTKFSQVASLEYVKTQYRSKGFPWDWTVLTERMFKDLKLANIGHPLFVTKWDWDYLSEHIDRDFVLENLEKYNIYWNWEIVFKRIVTFNNKHELSFLDKIALVISNISDRDKSKAAWSALSRIYSYNELKKVIRLTLDRRNYWWDIDYFCQHEDFNVFADLEEFRNIVDWEAISLSKAVDNSLKFNPKLKIKPKAWTEDVQKLLSDSRNRWNFKSLSTFESLRDQRWFISRFKDRIDWEQISRTSKIFAVEDKQELNEVIEAYKNYLDFKILSERTDVNIEQIIRINPKADYDYNTLMQRGIVKVSMSIVEQIPDYAWDLNLLTSSAAFIPDAAWLSQKIDEDLNWEVLTTNDKIKAWSSEELLHKMAARPEVSSRVNWKYITGLNDFPITTDLLFVLPFASVNWKAISQRKSVFNVISEFKDMLDWKILSASKHLNVKLLDTLEAYKDYLDWSIICSREEFRITNDIVERFADYLDWDKVSSSLEIQFTRPLVDKYQDKWNWPVLVKNRAFNNKFDVSDMPYLRQTNIVEFISHFPRRPQAFHFTHMSNALRIIRAMKLQSRNYAEGNFTNSAGSNVHRTAKAHRFARFYFMPKSPTQFYNECLGKDKGDRYYMKARNLGLPKCPLPVFFIFDVEELLMTMPDKCYYSTGNMQKDSSRSFKVIENPNRIKAREIYINSFDTFDERQQEFLVEGELDFSKLHKVQICCYDSYQAQILKKELAGTKWEDVITTNGNLYEHCNKEITFDERENSIRISTNGYRSSFEFKVSYTGEQAPNIVNRNMVLRQRGNNIYVQDSVELDKDIPFEVYFETKDPRVESWLIYKNR